MNNHDQHAKLCIYIYIINIIHFWCLIRRPRQTQGGARQGIRLLTLFSKLGSARNAAATATTTTTTAATTTTPPAAAAVAAAAGAAAAAAATK